MHAASVATDNNLLVLAKRIKKREKTVSPNNTENRQRLSATSSQDHVLNDLTTETFNVFTFRVDPGAKVSKFQHRTKRTLKRPILQSTGLGLVCVLLRAQ